MSHVVCVLQQCSQQLGNDQQQLKNIWQFSANIINELWLVILYLFGYLIEGINALIIAVPFNCNNGELICNMPYTMCVYTKMFVATQTVCYYSEMK